MYSSKTPESSVDQARVIRPVIERWIPRWARSDASSKVEGSADVAGATNAEPCVESSEEYLASIEQLQSKSKELATSKIQLMDSLSIIVSDIDSIGLRRKKALKRLSLVGDVVPEIDHHQPTLLQESYLNVEVALKILHRKHAAVSRKVALLQEHQDSVAGQIETQVTDLRLVSHAGQQNPEDDFRHAA